MDTTMKPTTAILERIRQNSGKNQDEVFTRLFRYLLRPDLYYLRDEKQKLQLESAGRDELKKRITDMGEFLKSQPTAITEYDERLIRRLIEKVTIYADKFTVEFKSGVTVDVDEYFYS